MEHQPKSCCAASQTKKCCKTKKDRPFLKAFGSVLLAIIASSHHWVHTLLLALGLTTLGAGLFSVSPLVKIVFLFVSLFVSIWFLVVAKRKWHKHRPAAWVYLISSIISIVIVVSSLPQTFSDMGGTPQQDPLQLHQQHHQK